MEKKVSQFELSVWTLDLNLMPQGNINIHEVSINKSGKNFMMTERG